MPIISIIVPVYNVEKYLEQCIESILRQTFSDFELILVDDGSPDSSGEICDKYKEKDDRISVIHRINGGLSAARNSGMDIACGQYITFIDSDDMIPKDYLEIHHEAIVNNNADMTICGAQEFSVVPEYRKSDYSYEIMDNRLACLEIYQPGSKKPINAWGKFYKRCIISQMRFPEGRIHEDQFFVPIAVYNSKKIVWIENLMYDYRINLDGITKSKFTLKRYDDLWAVDYCITYFQSRNEDEIALAAKKRYIILKCIYSIYARRDHVIIPNNYKVSVLSSLMYLRKNVSRDKYQYYLSQIYPRAVLIDSYVRKVEGLVGKADTK